MSNKKLYRTEGPYKSVAGVCGGVAEYFDVDPTLVRVGGLILILCTFPLGLLAYLGCAIIIPRKSDVYPL